MRTAADEARSPKYSHVERERRWLVDPTRMPPLPDGCVLIEDRYLRDTRLRLRRMTDAATGETALKLAKKYESGDPAARPMVNASSTPPNMRRWRAWRPIRCASAATRSTGSAWTCSRAR